MDINGHYWTWPPPIVQSILLIEDGCVFVAENCLSKLGQGLSKLGQGT